MIVIKFATLIAIQTLTTLKYGIFLVLAGSVLLIIEQTGKEQIIIKLLY